MNLMIKGSLILNILVLVPVCAGLLSSGSWAFHSFGEATPARGILLSIYLTIMIASAVLLYFHDPKLASLLFAMQIVYKVTTPFTVGTLRNPVVISNLFIAAFHLVTLVLIVQNYGNPLLRK